MKSGLLGNLFFKVFVSALGLIFLIPSAYKLYSYAIFRNHAVAVYGQVERSMGGGDLGGRPFIDYKDTHGNVHNFRSKAKTDWFFSPKKGEKIKVLFLKDDPQKVIVDSVSYYIFFPLLFFAVGATLLFYVFTSSWRELKDYVRLRERT